MLRTVVDENKACIKRHRSAIVLLLLCLVVVMEATAQSSTSRPDLNGNWALKEDKLAVVELSDSVESFSVNLLIEQSNDILKIRTITKRKYRKRSPKEEEVSTTMTYYLDGRGEINSSSAGTYQVESVTEVKGDKIVITRFMMKSKSSKNREVLRVEEWFIKSGELIMNAEPRRTSVGTIGGSRQVFARI